MTQTPHISRAAARKIILTSQGLIRAKPFGNGPDSVSKTVAHLGYVQLDTISVVARAHHHVLWNRIPAYQQEWLTKAQTKHRSIFEYWSHAAAFLPMKDYRFSLPVMNAFRNHKDRWPGASKADMKNVMNRIREEGPLMSRDFESSHKGGTWWDWKPAKWALQRLFLEGRLMVSHREGFQRVYDLPERIIPEHINTSSPSPAEYYAHLIIRTLEAQGLATRNELFHLRHISHKGFDTVLRELMEAECITPVLVEGNITYYTLPSFLEWSARLTDRITFLSPFDNSIIWRKRLRDIFDFDYTLECYVPVSKRRYGYFCLPILYRDRFAGRADMKADRKKSILQVHKIFWNEGSHDLEYHDLFKASLQSFTAFNKCETFKINPG